MAGASVADRLNNVLPNVYALSPLEEFPRRMLPLILALLGGDKACYHLMEVATGDLRVLALPHPEVFDERRDARMAYMHQHPLLAHFTRTDSLEGRTISDFLPTSEYHRLPLYGEFFRHLDMEDQLLVGVSSAATGYLAGFSVERGYPGFTPEDRHLFEILRPHLATAHANAARYSRALQTVGPELTEPARRLDRLTTRQLEILQCLAAGRSNVQIAAALNLSPGTVRKHLEHILRRLGVTTRTAAAVAYVAGNRASSEEWWTSAVPLVVTIP